MQRAGNPIHGMFAAALLLISACTSTSVAEEQKTLYQRLGGYDAIAAVVDDFLGRMIADEQLGRFFAGLGDDRKMRARQLTVDFVCKAAGGPCYYAGRDMKSTHRGMGITDEDWDKSVELLVETLDEFKVPEAEKKAVLDLIGSLEYDIVNGEK